MPQGDEMNWEKCASVCPGGKQFFYHLNTGGVCINVTWGRVSKKWVVSHGPNYSVVNDQMFDNPKAAKNFVEENLSIFTKGGNI